ncbi:MAG TPA: hypothetical protein VLH77_04970, partial [Gammaproteobacteria bacterium]|nr:hypothetical protein [Gammaproteobacteria bacterium]
MNKFLSFIVMGLGLAVMPNAQALVYKCVAQEGAITYQDITCATLHPDNRTLVITVNQRLNNRSNTHTRVITLIKKEERSRITAAGRRHQIG